MASASENKWFTADLSDENYNDVQVLEPGFRHFGKRKKFFGEIYTARLFEDNSLMKTILKENGKGKVLVVDAHDSKKFAFLGDNIANLASKNNWSGVIINGPIRDSEEIAEIDVGVYAKGTIPRKTPKTGPSGIVGEELSFGGVVFIPKHYVYVDLDGVIVSTKNLISKI